MVVQTERVAVPGRRDDQQDRAGGCGAQPRLIACAARAPARPSAFDTPARSRRPRTSRNAATGARGCAPHTLSHLGSGHVSAPSGESTASRSRSCPSSRSPPARGNPRVLAATRPLAAAPANPRRRAHRSTSRTDVPPASPRPLVPPAAQAHLPCLWSRPPQTTRHATDEPIALSGLFATGGTALGGFDAREEVARGLDEDAGICEVGEVAVA